MKRLAAVLLFVAGCAHKTAGPAPSQAAIPDKKLRLAAVTWPTGTAVMYCTRRLDDFGKPVGVAGPCYRLEAGDEKPLKVLSWAALGRFETSSPDTAPSSLGGRCKIELVQGQRAPELVPARVTWVTPTRRQVLDDWMPTDDPAAIEADGFTVETSFAPEGEWMAILHVAVGLGEGERVVQVPSAKLLKVPACE